MTEPNYQFISIGERAYTYIRQYAIKTIDDAFIELITNCIDAYAKTTSTNKQIFIEITDETTIKIRDYAIGLTSVGLQACFLQVGEYTSDAEARGFFSRGAKDVSALGNVTFKTIKDGKYSECILRTDAYGALTVTDVDATPELRQSIKMGDGVNGLEVTLDLLPHVQSVKIDSVYTALCKRAVLRDIMSNPINNITLTKYDTVLGQETFNKRVQYVYHEGSKLLNIEFDVPGYPGSKATFCIMKTTVPIEQPVKEQEMEFGFLIKDGSTIFEVSTLDDRFRWNPYMNSLYGFLSSDSIKRLLLEYDMNGPTIENPYPIIDPSRTTGINKIHPFIKAMIALPLARLDLILRELNKALSSKSVSIEDIDELLDELTNHGINLMDAEEIKVNYMPTYDGDLIKGINEDRAEYVTYEESYLLSGNYSTEEVKFENYIKETIIKLNQEQPDAEFVYYVGPNNELVQVHHVPDLNVTNEPINILELLDSDQINELADKPYIYKLSNTGEIMKLYVFQRGILDNNGALDPRVVIKPKMFNIEFMNDINISQRYIIDTTESVTIKLNLNNTIIAKNFANNKTGETTDLLSLYNFTSTQSLIFFKDLLTDILTDLIIKNDTENGKLVLDATSSVVNSQKLLDYRYKIMVKIEDSVDAIFDRYIHKNTEKKITNLNNELDILMDIVITKINIVDSTIDTSDIDLLIDKIKYINNSIIE
jgi:hypothetical protein